ALFFPCSSQLRSPHSFPTRRSSDLLFNKDMAAALECLPREFGVEVVAGANHNQIDFVIVDQCLCAGHQLRETETSSDLVSRYPRSEEHTSELQSLAYLVCRLLLEKK